MRQLLLLSSLLVCFITSFVQAQTQIAYQGFEQSATDNWGLTFSTPACNRSGDIWDYSTGFSSLTPSQGATFWGVQDLYGKCGSSKGEALIFANTPVAGFNNIEVLFDYHVIGFDNGDDVFYTLILDGIPQPQVQLVNGGGTGGSTGGYVTQTLSIPNGTLEVGLEVFVDQDGGKDRAAFDNFILQGDPTTSCTQSITQYAPNTGPAGTEVRITGVGFTNSSTVTFNGVNASNVQFVSTTELIATAPTSVSTGNIVVTENSCDVTAGTFTAIAGATTCSTTFSDLIISEIYDKSSGSLGYIELYNGTGATIDLTLYQIDRYGTLTASSVGHTYTFPTTGVGSSIAPGQVLVGRVGRDRGGLEDFIFTGSTSGFNDDDRLELVLKATSAVIDDWHDQSVSGGKGYSYLRNTTIAGPSPTYKASEWSGSGKESTTDLGKYNIAVSGSVPNISTQPTDANACEINLAVAATAGGGGTLTYQWFFNPNDGTTAGWSVATAGDFTGASFSGGTTDNLVITGNLASFEGYQFYCEVTENGNCPVVTEAVQFSLTTDRFFRSATTGDWTDVSTWEVATSNAGPWNHTCIYPTASNSDYIHIMATHQVTVDEDLVVDEVVIELDGEVIIADNHFWKFANGAGVDLQIFGTLTDNGKGNLKGLKFATNSATWVYGSNGTVVKTASSSVIEYRDHYEGGISAVPATATWRYRYTGNSNRVVVSAVNMFYPNLYFESTNGAHSFSHFTECLHGGSGGFATVKGSFFVGASGTAPVEVFNINTNGTPMQILGDLVLGGNGASGNSILHNNKGGGIIGTGLEVHNDLLIAQNGKLDYSDGTSAADGIFRLHGDWNNLNTGHGFKEGQSTVAFVGGVTQNVDKSGTDENFYNIVVNKPSGYLQNNVDNMIVEKDALFIRGIIRTSASKYLVFKDVATATGASDISHVDGPVVKETFTGTSTVFTYPTGDNNIYGPIGIKTRYHKGEPFIAHYHNNGYGTYTLDPADLDHVSHLEYWDLDEQTAGSGENLKVTLHWGAHSDIITTSSLRVAHFYKRGSNPSKRWEREGNTPVITGNATQGSVESDYVTSFSPFTIADIIYHGSLPLNLLGFEANKVEETTALSWDVENEQMGDVYHLQRSSNGYDFETIASFETTADNSLAHYEYIDETPLFGHNYYRIHQVDYVGVSDYSPTKVVEFNHATAINSYPNPASNNIELELPNVQGEYHIQMVDALGRVVLDTTCSGHSRRQQLDVAKLATGNYILQILTTRGILNSKKITIIR